MQTSSNGSCVTQSLQLDSTLRWYCCTGWRSTHGCGLREARKHQFLGWHVTSQIAQTRRSPMTQKLVNGWGAIAIYSKMEQRIQTLIHWFIKQHLKHISM